MSAAPSAGKNVCEQVTIGFSFPSDWSRKWREILPIAKRSNQNQRNCVITFDSQLKITLMNLIKNAKT